MRTLSSIPYIGAAAGGPMLLCQLNSMMELALLSLNYTHYTKSPYQNFIQAD